MSDKKRKIEFPLEKCFAPFEQSFDRVKYFSQITENINTKSLPKSWEIKNKSGVNYMINAPKEDKKEYLIEGYKHFMLRYLARDTIESFALSLDNLFFSLSINGKKILSEKTLYDALSKEEKILFKLFCSNGIYGKSGKIKLLKKHFGLELPEPHSRIISNLKDIRDCLSHRNGIVGENDGTEDKKGKRKFHWATLGIFCVGSESGKKFELEFNKPLAEPATVCAKIDTKDNFKSFEVGDTLSFSSSEIYEIAWSLQMITKEYLRQIDEKILSKVAA